jgi:hypothetical protein
MHMLPNSIEQSPSYEAYSHSASQEIPSLLWNYVHKSLPLVLIHCVRSSNFNKYIFQIGVT